MPDIVELDGKVFISADKLQIPEWACVNNNNEAQLTLTLKDDDLFLITDTLGNISGCLGDGAIASMGLFCRDTRFLSRLELQIEGRSPVLLSSNAQKGFALSALCANPRIEERDIPAETIGIEREIVLNGGLFEEITVTNYSTQTIKFELTLSFDADFMDLFEIRGFGRKGKGRLLRRIAAPRDGSPGSAKQNEVGTEFTESAEGDRLPVNEVFDPAFLEDQPPSLYDTSTELTMAYEGLDGAVMESQVQFMHHLPDQFKGYTAIWELELESHRTERLGYRLEMLTNSRPVSTVNIPQTLMQAKAAELMEEQEWRASITQIRSDNRAFNQVIQRAEHDIYLLRQNV